MTVVAPLSLGLVLLVAGQQAGAEPAAAPANARPGDSAPRAQQVLRYMGRVIAPTMHWSGAAWLQRETREREERTSELLIALGLRPGMTVCDVGAGSGYHALPMARRVGPKGRVLAVDVQQEMLDLLGKAVAAARLSNVTAILGATDDPRLPVGACDLILLVDVYHELSEPAVMLGHFLGALAPGGQVVLVEFRGEDPKVPIKPEHKMSKAQVVRELRANGFMLRRAYDRLPWQHVLFFAPTLVAPPQ